MPQRGRAATPVSTWPRPGLGWFYSFSFPWIIGLSRGPFCFRDVKGILALLPPICGRNRSPKLPFAMTTEATSSALWAPSVERVASAQLTAFMESVKAVMGFDAAGD